MSDKDQNELYEEFLRTKLAQREKTSGGFSAGSNTSLMPSDVYNPDGTLNTYKALKKLGNPSVLLALIVSATNLYLEYEQMKLTVQKQKEEIAELRKDIDHYKEDSALFLEKTRERFRMNESVQRDLHMIINNMRLEMRIRQGQDTYIPDTTDVNRAPSRTEQLRLLSEDTNSALDSAMKHAPQNDPLEGLEF